MIEVIASGASEDVRSRFAGVFEDGLRAAGFEVTAHAETLRRLARNYIPEGCSFGPCMTVVGKAIGTRLALVARVAAEGSSYAFVMTLVDTATGTPVAQASEACAVCTLDEAVATATKGVVALGKGQARVKVVDSLASQRRCDARLRVTRAAAWWTVAAAVVATAGGAWELAKDERTGFGLVGAGAGLGAAAVVLFLSSGP